MDELKILEATGWLKNGLTSIASIKGFGGNIIKKEKLSQHFTIFFILAENLERYFISTPAGLKDTQESVLRKGIPVSLSPGGSLKHEKPYSKQVNTSYVYSVPELPEKEDGYGKFYISDLGIDLNLGNCKDWNLGTFFVIYKIKATILEGVLAWDLVSVADVYSLR